MKLDKFLEVNDGFENMHILVDYDRTITVDSKDNPSIVSILRKEASEKFSSYSAKSYALKDKYIAFENDPSYGQVFRTEMMNEWWTKHLELMIAEGMSEGFVNQTVDKHQTVFRDGFEELNNFCKENGVPLIIMSAGIGNMIRRVLTKEGLWHDGMHVVSNEMIFDDGGMMIDYSRPVIHTFSKNEASIRPELKKKLKARPNVILMGDSLGDANMADGIEHGLVCKIAFERQDTTPLLKSEYLSLFDEVMSVNESFWFLMDQLTKKI